MEKALAANYPEDLASRDDFYTNALDDMNFLLQRVEELEMELAKTRIEVAAMRLKHRGHSRGHQ